MQHFNPIQSKWVVAAPMRRVSLLQQSIPLGVAILYTLVQKFLTFVALKAKENIIFAHNFILERPKQTKQLVVLIFNQVYFSFH